MIQFYVSHDQLCIDLGTESTFLTRSLLYSLEFQEKFGTNIFYFDDLSQTTSVLLEIVELLNHYNQKLDIDYVFDDECKSYLEQAQQEQEEQNQISNEESYEERIQNVKVVKSSKWSEDRQLTDLQTDALKQAIVTKHAANFSVPGSGKTTMALSYYEHLRTNNEIDNLTVIAPSRVAFLAWEDDWFDCYGVKPEVNHIVGSNIGWKRKYDTADINLMTYNSLPSRSNELIRMMRQCSSMLILDESHKIKQFSADNLEEKGKWRYHALRIAPEAKYRMILTGTPMPWDLKDLWGQFRFLLCSDKRFFDGRVFQKKPFNDVKSLIKPYYYRISKSQLNLPKADVNEIMVSLEPHQQEIYSELHNRLENTFDDMLKSDPVLLEKILANRWLRLRQCAVNPALLAPNLDITDMNDLLYEFEFPDLIRNYSNLGEVPAKLQKAEDIALKLVGEGKKVIIWNSFLGDVDFLSKKVQEIKHVTITGEEDVDENNREKVQRFKTDPETMILITTPNSCGEAISLHNICTDAIYVDRSFDAGLYMQSLDRIHRYGMNSDLNVNYHLLIAKDTIDELIHYRLDERHKNMKRLLDDADDIMPLNIEEDDKQNVEWYLKNRKISDNNV